MGHVLDGILHMPPGLALALVFLLPAVEASIFVGVLVPGEVGVILGGVLANQHKLPLAAVLAAGICGAIIGDSIGYWVGRALRRCPLLTRLPEQAGRKREQIQRTEGHHPAPRGQGGLRRADSRLPCGLSCLASPG